MVKIADTKLPMQPSVGAAPVYPATAAIAGHPVHPILVTFPVAFLCAALVTDITYLASHNAFWANVSFWALCAGVVTGLFAAVFGLIDFLTIPRVRATLHGWLHPIAAVVSVTLAAINSYLRFQDAQTVIASTGLILSILTVIVLLGAGWWGGELAYRHRIGVMAAVSAVPEGPDGERVRVPDTLGDRFVDRPIDSSTRIDTSERINAAHLPERSSQGDRVRR